MSVRMGRFYENLEVKLFKIFIKLSIFMVKMDINVINYV